MIPLLNGVVEDGWLYLEQDKVLGGQRRFFESRAQLSGSAVGSIYNQKLRDTGMTELPLGLSISEFSEMRTS